MSDRPAKKKRGEGKGVGRREGGDEGKGGRDSPLAAADVADADAAAAAVVRVDPPRGHCRTDERSVNRVSSSLPFSQTAVSPNKKD